MSKGVFVYLAIPKENWQPNHPVHFTHKRSNIKPIDLFCGGDEWDEYKRKPYRASGSLGTPRYCGACLDVAGPYAVLRCDAPLKAREPRPESAEARTLPLDLGDES